MSLPEPSASRAVLVGVAAYDRPGLTPLPSAGRNVGRLAELLTDDTIWGLPPEHCRQVLDPGSDAVVALAIAEFAAEAHDTLFVYFAGHGLVARSGELILATTTTDPRWPEFSGLRYSWIRQAVAGSRARRTIVVVDSCFSGRAVDAMSGDNPVAAAHWEIAGAYVLTATSANTTALAPEGAIYTAFSGSLLGVLADGWHGGPPLLRLSDIYELIRKDMVRSGRPQPLQMSTSRIGELPLIRNVAHRGHAITDGRRTAGLPAVTALPDDIEIRLRIVGYHRLSTLKQVDAQLAFIGLLNDGFRHAGTDPSRWSRRPTTGGEIITMPGGSVDLLTLAHLLREVASLLHKHDAHRPLRDRLRLRAALRALSEPHVPASFDATGPASDPPSEVALQILLSPRLAPLIGDDEEYLRSRQPLVEGGFRWDL